MVLLGEQDAEHLENLGQDAKVRVLCSVVGWCGQLSDWQRSCRRGSPSAPPQPVLVRSAAALTNKACVLP